MLLEGWKVGRLEGPLALRHFHLSPSLPILLYHAYSLASWDLSAKNDNPPGIASSDSYLVDRNIV